ncbi:hypothetical protein PoB_002029700 [Plakobranchus ocellatus]|uniref:Uncharacterized protein n=1 Tax=Plakobranchus ocellatus TaxID=259542 RepID=A0AAV3ZH19_9GAST|nr:hypothetical protein PoB_002029700 [Plakobranchus ocellatus]
MKQSVAGKGASNKKIWHLYVYISFCCLDVQQELPTVTCQTMKRARKASLLDSDVEQSSQASPASLACLQTVDTQRMSSAVSNTLQRRKRKVATS